MLRAGQNALHPDSLMKISTWNINGIKARLDGLLTWLEQAKPDVACLQEIKSIDENFPSERFEELGYNVAVHGQKSFNGVAILSKKPFDEIIKGLPGDDSDDHARYLEVVISTDSGVVRVASIYLPNGNPVELTPEGAPVLGSKYDFKLKWFARLEARARALMYIAMETPITKRRAREVTNPSFTNISSP